MNNNENQPPAALRHAEWLATTAEGALGYEARPAPRKYAPTTEELAELDRRFTYHAPQPDQQPRYREIRSEAQLLAHIIITDCPPSRERATALTHLDAVVMYANAAIARHED